MSFAAKYSIELLLYKHQHSLQKIFIAVCKTVGPELADYRVNCKTMGLGIDPRTANVTLFPGEMMAIWPWTTMDYHGLPWTTMDYHGLPWSTMDYHGLPWSTMVYHGLPWTTMDYHGLPRSTMDYHGLLWSTMDYHGLPWSTMIVMVIQPRSTMVWDFDHGRLWLKWKSCGWLCFWAWLFMVGHVKTWLTTKNCADYGSPWLSFRLGHWFEHSK